MRNPNLQYCLLLLLFCLPGLLIIGTAGDFPLNDDWAYALSVKELLENGRLVIDDWPAMSLVAQVLWGTLFCEVFGFSFETLRWSTLLNAYLASVVMYFLTKRMARPSFAFLAGLTLLLNPLFFSLSYTFMTDVHFIAAFLASILFFTRFLEQRRFSDLVLATGVSIISVLIRQPGLFVPLAFGVVLLIKARNLTGALAAIGPFILSFASLKTYLGWLESQQEGGETVGGFLDLIGAMLTRSAGHFFTHSMMSVMYVGLFLIPLVLLLLPSVSWRPMNKKLLGFCILLLLIGFFPTGQLAFPIGNIFYNLGLGPKLLKDAYYWYNVHPQISRFAWSMVDYEALAGTIGVVVLLVGNLSGMRPLRYLKELREENVLGLRLGLTLISLAYFAFVISITSYFDRYNLPLIVCVSLLIFPRQVKPRKGYTIASTALLALIMIFDIAATHDYLSWNKARNLAYAKLTQQMGYEPYSIDAGFEINGWRKAGPINHGSFERLSWWFVTDDQFVLTFGEIKGFEKIAGIPFKTLLPPGTDSIFILEKIPVEPLVISDEPIFCDMETLSEDGSYFLSENGEFKFEYGLLQNGERSRSGHRSIKLGGGDSFGLTVRFPDPAPGDEFLITIWRSGPSREAGLVFTSDKANQFYLFDNTNIVLQEKEGWQKLQLHATIPDNWKKDKAAFYVWNPGGEDVWFDDLEIQMSNSGSEETGAKEEAQE